MTSFCQVYFEARFEFGSQVAPVFLTGIIKVLWQEFIQVNPTLLFCCMVRLWSTSWQSVGCKATLPCGIDKGYFPLRLNLHLSNAAQLEGTVVAWEKTRCDLEDGAIEKRWKYFFIVFSTINILLIDSVLVLLRSRWVKLKLSSLVFKTLIESSKTTKTQSK